jgi:hypothetical protein
MRKQRLLFFMIALTVSVSGLALGQMKGLDMPMQPAEKISGTVDLKPAEVASVKILSPKQGQVFKGDQVPLQFKLIKGKQGNHVHAYVDGELMGMFEGEKGTLTGIQPGSHTLELRAAVDHMTELNAADKVKFVVK